MKPKRNHQDIGFGAGGRTARDGPRADRRFLGLGEGLPQIAVSLNNSGAEVLYATDRDGQKGETGRYRCPLGNGTHWTLANPQWARMEGYYSDAAFPTKFAGKCPDTHAVSAAVTYLTGRGRR
jgi:hypothetical protein